MSDGAGDRDSSPDRDPDRITVSIIVPVHGAVDAFERLAQSLAGVVPRFTEALVVDDASPPDAAAGIARICRAHGFDLVRPARRRWYPGAVNLAASQLSGDVLLILNSDTVVPPPIVAATRSSFAHPHTVVLGFVGNAAGYQSVPWNPDAEGPYPVDPLPKDMSALDMAARVARLGLDPAIEVPFVNGFAMAVRRALFDLVGGFDTTTFPYGYGEELDLCLRLRTPERRLVVDASTYVYHEKSRSYGRVRRDELIARSRQELDRRWGSKVVEGHRLDLRRSPGLRRARMAVGEQIYGRR